MDSASVAAIVEPREVDPDRPVGIDQVVLHQGRFHLLGRVVVVAVVTSVEIPISTKVAGSLNSSAGRLLYLGKCL
jgi:hypothetical protein